MESCGAWMVANGHRLRWRVLQQDPQHVRSLLGVGMLCMEQSELELAGWVLVQSLLAIIWNHRFRKPRLELDRDEVRAVLEGLVECHLRQGWWEAAQERAEQLLLLDPTSRRARLGLAAAKERTLDLEEAACLLHEVLEDQVQAEAHLGISGDAARCLAAGKKFLAKEPPSTSLALRCLKNGLGDDVPALPQETSKHTGDARAAYYEAQALRALCQDLGADLRVSRPALSESSPTPSAFASVQVWAVTMGAKGVLAQFVAMWPEDGQAQRELLELLQRQWAQWHCPICLESLEDARCAYLPCEHVFHEACLALCRCGACPTCRAPARQLCLPCQTEGPQPEWIPEVPVSRVGSLIRALERSSPFSPRESRGTGS
ncbi:unnamed protein product [Effrenium voratum]|nr:unnamed protein product [Effrenium voratum]